jgi:haloacetate dehalogenase
MLEEGLPLAFLAQPFPLPETLIAGDPVFYLEWTLRSWARGNCLDTFDPRSLESYREQLRDPTQCAKTIAPALP